jgi:hypothetical protein
MGTRSRHPRDEPARLAPRRPRRSQLASEAISAASSTGRNGCWRPGLRCDGRMEAAFGRRARRLPRSTADRRRDMERARGWALSQAVAALSYYSLRTTPACATAKAGSSWCCQRRTGDPDDGRVEVDKTLFSGRRAITARAPYPAELRPPGRTGLTAGDDCSTGCTAKCARSRTAVRGGRWPATPTRMIAEAREEARRQGQPNARRVNARAGSRPRLRVFRTARSPSRPLTEREHVAATARDARAERRRVHVDVKMLGVPARTSS